MHDLRRTVRSLLSRTGVRPEISECALGHVIKAVEGVYDHYSYSDEKADALVRLAALIGQIVDRQSAVRQRGAATRRAMKRHAAIGWSHARGHLRSPRQRGGPERLPCFGLAGEIERDQRASGKSQ